MEALLPGTRNGEKAEHAMSAPHCLRALTALSME
jgi:hypothetical protein